MSHGLNRTGRRVESIAVLFLDLDDFKVINDSLGHNMGDQLLVAVGERLKSCVRTVDTVSRLGGDEFTILLESINNLSDAIRVVERITQQLQAGGEKVADRDVAMTLLKSLPKTYEMLVVSLVNQPSKLITDLVKMCALQEEA